MIAGPMIASMVLTTARVLVHRRRLGYSNRNNCEGTPDHECPRHRHDHD